MSLLYYEQKRQTNVSKRSKHVSIEFGVHLKANHTDILLYQWCINFKIYFSILDTYICFYNTDIHFVLCDRK